MDNTNIDKIDVYLYTIEQLSDSIISIRDFLKEFGDDIPIYKLLKINDNQDNIKCLYLCCFIQEKDYIESICNKHKYKLYSDCINKINVYKNSFNKKNRIQYDYLNRNHILVKTYDHIGSLNGYKINEDGFPVDNDGKIVESLTPFWL